MVEPLLLDCYESWMGTESAPILVQRAGLPSDVSFVSETWLQSDKQSPCGRDDGPGYFRRQKQRIARILHGAELRVLCAEGAPDAILAWAVVSSDPPRCYYVYVRSDIRRQGLAKRLLADLAGKATTYTHRPIVRGVVPPQNWQYDRTPNYVGAT